MSNAVYVVASRYKSMLTDLGHVAKQNTSTCDNNHILWMIDQILNDQSQSLTKKHRWLGFVQAYLIFNNLLTIDGERDATRDVFNGE